MGTLGTIYQKDSNEERVTEGTGHVSRSRWADQFSFVGGWVTRTNKLRSRHCRCSDNSIGHHVPCSLSNSFASQPQHSDGDIRRLAEIRGNKFQRTGLCVRG